MKTKVIFTAIICLVAPAFAVNMANGGVLGDILGYVPGYSYLFSSADQWAYSVPQFNSDSPYDNAPYQGSYQSAPGSTQPADPRGYGQYQATNTNSPQYPLSAQYANAAYASAADPQQARRAYPQGSPQQRPVEYRQSGPQYQTKAQSNRVNTATNNQRAVSGTRIIRQATIAGENRVANQRASRPRPQTAISYPQNYPASRTTYAPPSSTSSRTTYYGGYPQQSPIGAGSRYYQSQYGYQGWSGPTSAFCPPGRA